MNEDMENQAKALLDGERQEGGERDEGKKQEPMTNPIDQLRELTRGSLKLMRPIRAMGQDVTELRFDFCDLTSREMMEALDSVMVNNMFAISNEQAMALFAATAAKNAPMIEKGAMKVSLYDAKDILTMSAVDAVKAVQLAKLFYSASSQAGNKNISKG